MRLILIMLAGLVLVFSAPAFGSGTVVVNTRGNNVTITGDVEDNVLQISESGGKIIVFSVGGTNIIGGTTGIDAGDLENVTIMSKGGNDSVAVGFITIGGRLAIVTSSGDDDVFFEDVLVQGRFVVLTGRGDDSIQDFGGVEFSGLAKYFTGPGDDELFLGDDQINFLASLLVNFGSGNDLLDIDANNVILAPDTRLKLIGGGGVDKIMISAGTLSGALVSFEVLEVN